MLFNVFKKVFTDLKSNENALDQGPLFEPRVNLTFWKQGGCQMLILVGSWVLLHLQCMPVAPLWPQGGVWQLR